MRILDRLLLMSDRPIGRLAAGLLPQLRPQRFWYRADDSCNAREQAEVRQGYAFAEGPFADRQPLLPTPMSSAAFLEVRDAQGDNEESVEKDR
jgi:hypothetical protein